MSPSPLPSSVGLPPPTIPSSTGTSSAGPPPKTGFQPMPHSLQDYESHSHLVGSPQQVGYFEIYPVFVLVGQYVMVCELLAI